MKVMIDIPENMFNAIKRYDVEPVSPLYKIIRDGVVLSEKDEEVGKWIHRRVIAENNSVDLCVCPICNEEFSYDAETGIAMDNYKHCPNCGKRMEG